MNKKKTVLLAAGILVLLAIALTVGLFLSKDTFFDDLISETLDLYPYTVGLALANDGSYMRFEINPNIGGYIQELILEDNLKALKFINSKLGFSPALYEKMVNTTSAMGVQTDSNSKFEATWSYNSEKGLNIIYERN